MPVKDYYHPGVCRGEVRQCTSCGGRMCDCVPDSSGERVFTCYHGGETEAVEPEEE